MCMGRMGFWLESGYGLNVRVRVKLKFRVTVCGEVNGDGERLGSRARSRVSVRFLAICTGRIWLQSQGRGLM